METRMAHETKPKLAYTVPEVAAMLDCGEDAVRAGIRKGEIPAIWLGRLVKIPAEPFHAKVGGAPKAAA
jgi:excisionase family DNA binding protein